MKAISKGPILVKTTLEEQCFIGLSFDLNILVQDHCTSFIQQAIMHEL